jgi:hypothetical protein
MNFKFSQEIADRILDLVERGVLKRASIARAIGVRSSTFKEWLVKSNDGEETFLIGHVGRTMQFAEAWSLCRRLAELELRNAVLQKSIFGSSEPARKDGQLVWKLDRRAVPLDVETRIICGFHPDAFYINERGEVEPELIHTDAPVALQLRVLEAAGFAEYKPTTISEVTVRGDPKAPVGIQFSARTDFSGPPPAIAPPPPMPELEVIDDAEEADFAEQPSPPSVNITLAPEINVEIAEPKEPARPFPRVRTEEQALAALEKKPLSPLQIDLLQRARVQLAKPKE